MGSISGKITYHSISMEARGRQEKESPIVVPSSWSTGEKIHDVHVGREGFVSSSGQGGGFLDTSLTQERQTGHRLFQVGKDDRKRHYLRGSLLFHDV